VLVEIVPPPFDDIPGFAPILSSISFVVEMVEVVEMFVLSLSKRYFLDSFNFCQVIIII
jgi:hypothetical protein